MGVYTTQPEDTITIAFGGVRGDDIPDYLKERPQWVNWKLENRGGKPTKVPYCPRNGKRASTTDLMTWASFPLALAGYVEALYQGIGFVFCSADPFVGIDFDNCRNPETGEVGEHVRQIARKFAGAYMEISHSGTGLHIITRGKFKGGAGHGNLEIYDQDRYFAITGEVFNA